MSLEGSKSFSLLVLIPFPPICKQTCTAFIWPVPYFPNIVRDSCVSLAILLPNPHSHWLLDSPYCLPRGELTFSGSSLFSFSVMPLNLTNPRMRFVLDVWIKGKWLTVQHRTENYFYFLFFLCHRSHCLFFFSFPFFFFISWRLITLHRKLFLKWTFNVAKSLSYLCSSFSSLAPSHRHLTRDWSPSWNLLPSPLVFMF